jgi:hypothetical protein
MSFDPSIVLYLIKGSAVLVAAALVCRLRVKPILVRVIAVAAAVNFLLILYSLYLLLEVNPHVGIDYGFFWKAGRDVLAGADPYGSDHFAEHPFLNPPTALPLFALFALGSFSHGFVLWMILNAVACAGLVVIAQGALAAQGGLAGTAGRESDPPWQLDGISVLALTGVLLVSDASLLTVGIGQLSLLVALLLMAALAAQARGMAIVAGVLLSLATVKVGTMLPFLLLFLRRADWRTWVALAVTTLGLCLMTDRPDNLPGRLTTVLERIKQMESAGQVNDYSYEGTRPENILGFQAAIYRLGLRDRALLQWAQYAAVLVLGAWVARQVVGRERLPREAACALVALYSCVFLYHRSYDTVILVMPLVYCAGRARRAEGRVRWLFAACAVAMLLAMNLNVDFLCEATRLSLTWGAWGRVVQAVLLPYGTWLIVLTMVLLVKGARTPRAEAPLSLPHPTEVAAG